MIRAILLILCSMHLKPITCNYSSLYLDELHSLTELPLDSLIRIRSNLVEDSDDQEESWTGLQSRTSDDDDDDYLEEPASSRKLSVALPVAKALRRNQGRPTRRYEDHHEEKWKDTKISKIFQLAVTSLSFLAFGGYLLTLIITAIRRNAANGNNGVIILSGLQGLQGLQKYKRPKRRVRVYDNVENVDLELDRLYQGMLMVSRAYATYK